VAVIEIGDSILYIAGAIGMALAGRTGELNFADAWATLPMPEQGSPGWIEKPWWEIYGINGYGRWTRTHNGEPYAFIAQLANSAELKEFFDNPEQFQRSLFAGNLLLSMVEFRHLAPQPGYQDNLKQEFWHPNVYPLWPLMEPKDFTTEVYRIFGSSAAVISFALPDLQSQSDRFWPLWQAWKEKCVQLWTKTGDQRYWRYAHNIYSLNLPGEPPIQT
jgi:hypothetical protein